MSDLFGVGEVVGSLVSAWGQAKTNSQNRDLQQQANDQQLYMSNTAYQRGVKDMEAAGLNPMLAYTQGGASTPSPGVTRMDNIVPENVGQAFGRGASTAAQIALQKKQGENVDADTENKRAQAELISEQARSQREVTHRGVMDNMITSAQGAQRGEAEITATNSGADVNRARVVEIGQTLAPRVELLKKQAEEAAQSVASSDARVRFERARLELEQLMAPLQRGLVAAQSAKVDVDSMLAHAENGLLDLRTRILDLSLPKEETMSGAWAVPQKFVQGLEALIDQVRQARSRFQGRAYPEDAYRFPVVKPLKGK